MKMASSILLISLCLALAFLFLLPEPQAHADGGAPNLAYVAGGSHGISVIDIGQGKITNTISVTGDPHSFYLSLYVRFLYFTQPGLGQISIVSAQSKQTICTASLPGQPSLLAFDPGANILYAAGNGAARVTALNPTNCAIKHTITTDGPVYGLAMAVVGSGPSGGSGNQLWIAAGSSLSIYDDTGKQLTSIPIPGGPQYVSIPNGVTVYVTTRLGDVDAVHLGTRQVFPALLTGGTFGPRDYDAFTGEVYVPDQKHDQVDVLAPITSASGPLPHEPTRIIHLGVAPESIAITSDGQLGFIALSGGNVAMLDVPGGGQIFNTVYVGGTPHFIITGLYPPLIGTTPQQASTLSTIINILAYVFVIALILVPMLLLW